MAILALRPNGVGTETNVTYVVPGGTPHWQTVDEETADGETTYIFNTLGYDERDLYALPTVTGIFASVTVYINVSNKYNATGSAKTAILTNGTAYEGTARTLTDVWTSYSEIYTTNPNTGVAWTQDEIDALEAGVHLYGTVDTEHARCTQVYVEVDYTPVTPKTGSDTGIGADAQIALSPISAGETGTGTDALSALLATLLGSETGTGADAYVALSLISAGDTGTGTEAWQLFWDIAVALTLKPRSLNLTLKPRALNLTLERRSLNLTLPTR